MERIEFNEMSYPLFAHLGIPAFYCRTKYGNGVVLTRKELREGFGFITNGRLVSVLPFKNRDDVKLFGDKLLEDMYAIAHIVKQKHSPLKYTHTLRFIMNSESIGHFILDGQLVEVVVSFHCSILYLNDLVLRRLMTPDDAIILLKQVLDAGLAIERLIVPTSN